MICQQISQEPNKIWEGGRKERDAAAASQHCSTRERRLRRRRWRQGNFGGVVNHRAAELQYKPIEESELTDPHCVNNIRAETLID